MDGSPEKSGTHTRRGSDPAIIENPLIERILRLRARVFRHEESLPEGLRNLNAELQDIEDLCVYELTQMQRQSMTYDDLFE